MSSLPPTPTTTAAARTAASTAPAVSAPRRSRRSRPRRWWPTWPRSWACLSPAAVTDTSNFGTQEAWFYVTLLTIGYMISRGLAKAGSRDFYDDDTREA